MFTSLLASGLLFTPVSAATLDLSFVVRPDGTAHAWQVELDESMQASTRVPGDAWELHVRLDGPPEAMTVDLEIYEVVVSRSGRERLVLTSEQALPVVNGEPAALMLRANDSLWWRKKERELGFRPSDLLVEVTPQV